MHRDDGRTLLDRGDAALVWSPETGFSLMVPDYPDDHQMADEILALTAVFVRIDKDAEFRKEMADWFKSLPAN